MKLYFVRHGESKANLLQEFSNRGFKHGLTVRGCQQAAQLAQNLRGNPFTKIYTSPLKRAVQTAEILGERLDIPIETSDGLKEFDCGVLEGKSNAESWEVFFQLFEQWMQGQWEEKIPDGESHLEIQARFIPFINAVRQKHVGEFVLLIGHGGIFRVILPLILENISFDFVRNKQIDHTSPIIAEERENGLFCTHW